MIIKKWNYEKHNYEDKQIPDDWKCKTFSNDLEEKINCVNCGKKMVYGDSYTSMEYHTEAGFGYMVCEKCNRKEWVRKNENI